MNDWEGVGTAEEENEGYKWLVGLHKWKMNDICGTKGCGDKDCM